LRQVALVLALQVGAPVDGKLPVAARVFRLFQEADGFGIRKVLELTACDMLQGLEDGVVDPLIEELEVGAAALQDGGDDVLEELLGELAVAVEVAERHL